MLLCPIAINEFVTLNLIRKSLTNGCHVVKFWTLVIGTVSQTLLAFNSSINFLMYPAVSKDFRIIFLQYFKSKLEFISKLFPAGDDRISRDTEDLENHNSDSSIRTSNAGTPVAQSQVPDGFENPFIHLEEVIEDRQVKTGFTNEALDPKNDPLSPYVAPARITSLTQKVKRIECLELPLNDANNLDPETTPFIFTANHNFTTIRYISGNEHAQEKETTIS